MKFEKKGENGFQEKIKEFIEDELDWDVPSSKKFKDGAPALDKQYKRDKDQEIYVELLKEQIIELNEDIRHADDAEKAIEALKTEIQEDSLLERNRVFHKLLDRGIDFRREDSKGSVESITAHLVDFDNPENNDLKLIDEMTYTGGNSPKKFDFIVLVNGIPLVVIETKTRSGNNVNDAVEDLKGYEKTAPDFFNSVLFNVSMTEHNIKVGAVKAPEEHNYYWRKLDGSKAKSLEILPELLDPESVLDILDNYVFYEETSEGLAKIIPRYMQYRASSKVIEVTLTDGLDRGLVWHTQGSGKSYTMLYSAQKILTDVEDSQVILVVDTDNLRGQMKDNLDNINFNRGNYSVINGSKKKEELEEKIKSGVNKLIVTTIHLFEEQDYGIQGADNTIVMSDEAHRFEEGDLGIYLENSLPNCQRFGFTGTPVREGSKQHHRDTFDFFQPVELDEKYVGLYSSEDYLDRYSIEQAIEDQLILEVTFDVVYPDWEVNIGEIENKFEEITKPYSKEKIHDLLVKEYGHRKIGELDFRVEEYSKYIANHFSNHLEPKGYKGMVVTPSRPSAAKYGEELKKRLGEEKVKTIISESKGKGKEEFVDEVAKRNKKEQVRRDFKRNENPKLLVVMNMFLTGFDAPKLKTIYLDRNLNNHKLLQTIARTNRKYVNNELGIRKEEGEIIDLHGVFNNLDDAFDYSETVTENAATSKEEKIQEFKQLLDKTYNLINDLDSVTDAVYYLEKNPGIGEEFSENFEKTRRKYFSLIPDQRVTSSKIANRYRSIKNIYEQYESSPEDNRKSKHKTEKIDSVIEENAEVSLENQDIEFTLDSQTASELKTDPKNKILKKKNDLITESTQFGKRYENLGERLEDVLTDWRNSEKSEEAVLEDLEKIENEIESVDNVKKERDFNKREFAVFQLLVEKYGDYFTQDEAEDISKKIEDEFEKNIDTSYLGWRRNRKTKKNLNDLIVDNMMDNIDVEFFRSESDWNEKIAEVFLESPTPEGADEKHY